MSASLTITKHDGALDAQTVTVKVEDNAKLSALRAFAEGQGLMSSRDLFNIANTSVSLRKASEERLLWTDIQDPEDDSVHINVGGKSFSAEDGLTKSEKELLFQKSRIGFGFDSSGEGGPRFTNRQVVAQLSMDRITFASGEEGQHDVVTTYSSRSSSYLEAGWVDASLAVKTPWVSVGVKASLSQSSAASASQKQIYITGRYNFAHCKLSMRDYISKLKPHPDFEEAIKSALAIPDETERTEEIRRVLDWYGTMFVTSVEVGGMKHSTTEKILDDKTTESSVKMQMSVALGKKFAMGGGTENKQTQQAENEFDSLDFHTIGGAIEASSLDKWRESLSDPRKWGVTRVLEVQSVLSLFDKATQLHIALALFKTPIYQFWNKVEKKNTLSTDPDISKIPTVQGAVWVSYGPIGTVLTVPLDGAVPLYHLYQEASKRHLFTCAMAERNMCLGELGFVDQGIACYVYATEKPGTVLLNRTWNGVSIDNSYTTSKDELKEVAKTGYLVDGGACGYIYPM